MILTQETKNNSKRNFVIGGIVVAMGIATAYFMGLRNGQQDVASDDGKPQSYIVERKAVFKSDKPARVNRPKWSELTTDKGLRRPTRPRPVPPSVVRGGR